jgi:predicted amidophosphoribosyltransferase
MGEERWIDGGDQVEPRPIGFPGCRLCPWRSRARPDVCLACLTASPGQPPPESDLARCSACGAIKEGGRCPTLWCRRPDRAWSVVLAVGAHRGGLQRAIVRYKYGGERWWAGVFGRLLAGYLDARAPWVEDFDLLVPMPAYAGPGARRSWDPVGEMVAVGASLLGPLWPVAWGAVVKHRETAPMSNTSRPARQRRAAGELRRALAVPDAGAVAGARILVVDDVLAEGSTLREVAAALRAAGAREVAGLVLARPEWRPGAGVSHPDLG